MKKHTQFPSIHDKTIPKQPNGLEKRLYSYPSCFGKVDNGGALKIPSGESSWIWPLKPLQRKVFPAKAGKH